MIERYKVTNMEFVKLQEHEYDEFAKSHCCANFLNSIYSGRKFSKKQWACEYLGLRDETGIQAAVLLVSTPLRNFRYFYAPRGFLVDFHNEALVSEFTNHLRTYMKEQNGLYLKIDPYVPYQQHDINGAVVEGGFRNDDVVSILKKLGYRHHGFTIGYDESCQCRWMSVLDLRGKSEESLLKEFDQQTRWSIHKALKMGIKITEETGENLDKLKRVMEHTAKRRGFSDQDKDYYEGMFEFFHSQGKFKAVYAQLDVPEYQSLLADDLKKMQEELDVVEANLAQISNSKKFNKRKKVLLEAMALLHKKQEEASALLEQSEDGVLTLAAATFAFYGNEVLYLTSGSYDQYKLLKGPYAIQWHMIRLALQEGYSFYNFYGISGLFGKDDDGFGVFDFKRGFQAEVVELIGDFTLPIQPKKYAVYQKLQHIKQKLR